MIVFGGNKFIPFLIEDSTYLAPKWYKLNFYNTYNMLQMNYMVTTLL